MKTVSKFSLVLILAGLTAVGISSLSQANPTSPPASVNHRLDNLAGGWIVEATPETQPPFEGLITFNADGGLLSSAQPMGIDFMGRPLYETPGYGNWIATRPNQAAFTFVALYTDASGMSAGKGKVVGKLQYDPRTDTWSGPFRFEVRDASGTVLYFESRGTINAARIAVETLD